MKRPAGSNADEWALFLEEHEGAIPFIAVQIAEAIDAASTPPRAVKEGWKMVPVEITEDMAAAMECQFSTEAQWSAALAVAPSCPATGVPTEEEIIEAMEPFYVYCKATGSRFFNMEEAARAILKLLAGKEEKNG